MPIENPRVVDFVSIDPITGEAVLTVSDHLDWTDPQRHLQLLQDKLQSYVNFAESGELQERFPSTRGRAPRVDVVHLHPIPSATARALERARSQLAAANLTLVFRSRPDDGPAGLKACE